MSCARSLLLCAAIAVPLSGCLGPATSRPTRLFVLTATETAREAGIPPTNLRLAVGRISLPDLVNRPQIVTRISPHEVRADDYAQWAESLETSIPRVISEDLARRMGTDQVFVSPWPSKIQSDLRLEGAILEFEGGRDGMVSLVVRWRWVRADGSEAHPLQVSSYRVPAANPSTEALVAAMSEALGALSDDLAAAIEASRPDSDDASAASRHDPS
jgi:uncharacterized lipoprotein YmbA